MTADHVYLSSNDPEPPVGTVVLDIDQRHWHRSEIEPGEDPRLSWVGDDEATSWTKVAGHYGPVRVLGWGPAVLTWDEQAPPVASVRVAAGERLVLMFDPPASRGALESMRAHLRETWPDLADRILMVNGVKTVAVIEKGEPE